MLSFSKKKKQQPCPHLTPRSRGSFQK